MDLSKHTQRPRRAYQALHTAQQGAYAPACKGMFTTPPPVNISQHFGLPNNCARIGSLLSAPAACYMHAPAPEPQGVDLRAPAEAPLGRGALCSFIASVKKNGVTKASPSGRTFFLLPYSPTPFLVGCLQDFCKRQNGENGACRTSANAKMEKMALAGLLQTSKWGKWSLQNFCKRQNGESGACRTSANVKMGKMALAELLQTSKWRKWCLQNFCKRRLIHGYVTLNT